MAIKRKVETPEEDGCELDAEDMEVLEREVYGSQTINSAHPAKALTPIGQKPIIKPKSVQQPGIIKRASKGLGVVKKKASEPIFDKRTKEVMETVAVGVAGATGAILRDNEEAKNHVAVRAMRAFVYSIDSSE